MSSVGAEDFIVLGLLPLQGWIQWRACLFCLLSWMLEARMVFVWQSLRSNRDFGIRMFFLSHILVAQKQLLGGVVSVGLVLMLQELPVTASFCVTTVQYMA